MYKSQVVLSLVAVLAMAVAAVLRVVRSQVAECAQLADGACRKMGFAYEAAGKQALLLAFTLFLLAALLGLFHRPAAGER